ncbi:MAG: hypothetical protein O3B90_01795 [Actinomycetota bacterium]|nr:hypothetical protein [Actinomycetota bacterium]
MNRRSIPAIVVLLAALVWLFVVGRDSVASPPAVFSSPAGTWMPSVTDTDSLTGSWFCPGIPATGEDGVGGSVVISNRNSEQLEGRFMVVSPEGLEVEQGFTVGRWSQGTIDVDAFVTTSFASVVVEIDGGRGYVEQIVNHPAGDSVAPCAIETSNEWYLADGFTVGGSVETLILTNPYDDLVLTDLAFATASGSSEPNAFQGFPVPAKSVKVIPIAELGNRDEPIIAASITTRGGRLVVGRAQHFTGGGRLGYDVSLAAPALRDQWWFADGERGAGITETFSIYNPTDDDVEVDVYFLGLPLEFDGGGFAPINVPARQVVMFQPFEGAVDDTENDPSDPELFTSRIPNGRHSVVFSTLAQPTVVVERVLTRPVGGSFVTSVVQGAPPRLDGFVATRWHIGVGPSVPTEDALIVYNVDNEQATITIEAVGPGGPSAIPSLTDIPLGPGAVITIDLTTDDVLDQELIVNSSNRVFIERSLGRGGDLSGRSGSWALPASNI